jgi:hypothetical protein
MNTREVFEDRILFVGDECDGACDPETEAGIVIVQA